MKLKGRRMLGTQWFLMGMDRNYWGIDENSKEIDLIRGSHQLEREKERCTNALRN